MSDIRSAIDSVITLPHGYSDFAAAREHLFECRAKSRLPENSRTVITVIFPYYLGEEAYRDLNISRYAVSEDYHIIAGGMLKDFTALLREKLPEYAFEPFIDSSPLPEVACAVRSGVGVRGRNGLLISPEYGTYIFIGEIVTDAPVPVDEPGAGVCLSCGACEKACPTGALKDGRVDASRCLSALNQKKGELTEEEKALIRESGCAWGCDACQTVCPMNKNIPVTPVAAFRETAIANIGGELKLEGRAYAWRGRQPIERNLKILGGAENN
ncbi:MAG: DUF1730 domain-containing protein [Clostridiales bacterium]|nr:DUF1730 domain-containing protein [Clostridiales bacterium]